MPTKGSWSSYKLRGFVELVSYRFCSRNITYGRCPGVAVAKPGHKYSMHQHQGFQLISANSGTWRKLDANKLKDDNPMPDPPKFNFLFWVRWLLGSILSLLLPFWTQKWKKLQRIEGEAEMVVEEVENVAEVIENVATKAEKVSAEVADILPEHGKLKEAALLAERVSKATAQDAQITIDFIHKVDTLKQDLDGLETLVEPIVNKIVAKESEGK